MKSTKRAQRQDDYRAHKRTAAIDERIPISCDVTALFPFPMTIESPRPTHRHEAVGVKTYIRASVSDSSAYLLHELHLCCDRSNGNTAPALVDRMSHGVGTSSR